MSYELSNREADQALRALGETYDIYAPRRFAKQGRYSDTDVVRYDKVHTVEEIVWDVKSDYPAKEVINPIQQTIFYFTEDEYRESKPPPANPSCSSCAPATSTPRRSRPASLRATAALWTPTTPGCASGSSSS